MITFFRWLFGLLIVFFCLRLYLQSIIAHWTGGYYFLIAAFFILALLFIIQIRKRKSIESSDLIDDEF